MVRWAIGAAGLFACALGCAAPPRPAVEFPDLRRLGRPITLTRRIAIDEPHCPGRTSPTDPRFVASTVLTDGPNSPWSVRSGQHGPSSAAVRSAELGIDVTYVEPHTNQYPLPVGVGAMRLVVVERVPRAFFGRLELRGEVFEPSERGCPGVPRGP